MTAPIRFKQRLFKSKSVNPQRDHDVEQIEEGLRQRHYSDDTLDDVASDDYDLAQRLNKKGRGLKNVKIGGMEN